MSLTTDPYFLGGRPSPVRITGANPGDLVQLLRSPTIGGAPRCPALIAPDCLDLAAPVSVVGSGVADSNGSVVLSYTSADPPAAPEVQLQAVVVGAGGGKLSDAPIVEMYATASDTDGDGLPDPVELSTGTDIADPDSDGDTVIDGAEVLLYRTDPTFDDSECLGFPAEELTDDPAWVDAMNVADLDGDGDVDLMTASTVDAEVTWYDNQNGSMRPPVTIGTNAQPVYMEGADLNGDDLIDILLVSAGTVGWYENLGGSFASRQSIGAAFGSGADGRAVDLDGDGDLDVSVVSDDKILWWENQGAGSFGLFQEVTATLTLGWGLAAGDLDGDGDQDLLSADNGSSGDLTWFSNDGTGSFSSALVIDSTGAEWSDVEAADLDDDGDLDVIATGNLTDAVYWYENDGSGSFSRRVLTTSFGYPTDVLAADIDGDGDLDVASIGHHQRAKVAWFENRGVEGFGPKQIIYNEGDPGSHLVFGDLDADGDDDLVTSYMDLTSSVVMGLENLGSRLDQDGDGLVRGAEECVTGTHPFVADTDGGGVDDGAEVDALADPLDPADD